MCERRLHSPSLSPMSWHCWRPSPLFAFAGPHSSSLASAISYPPMCVCCFSSPMHLMPPPSLPRLSPPPTSFSALACATRPTHSQEGSAMGYHMHLPCSDQPPPRTRAGAHALAGSMRLRPVGSRRGYDCCCGRERRRYGKTYSPPAMGENELLLHYTGTFAGRR